ncbi:MAG: rod shape-determining protein MreD [Succinatimonas sp.]|nr:rod shape-determining protein MreD [Succinatimonas sp.]
MVTKEHNRSLIFIFIPLILVALIFQIVHLSNFMMENRPSLLALILIFFTTLERFRFGIEIAFLIGLILDLLSGAPLGINALICAAHVYIISSQFKRFRLYVFWQQAIIIGIINLIINVIAYWLEHIIGQSYYEVNFLLPALFTAILWPLVRFLCLILAQTFSISINEEKKNL